MEGESNSIHNIKILVVGENLKKKSIFITIAICLIPVAFIGFIVIFGIIYEEEMYKDKIEYPLNLVDINDDSEYMLVKWYHSPMKTYEIITETQAIKENKSIFNIDNKNGIYWTTPDGLIYLYKNGKFLDSVPIDNTYTRKINYGTLQFQPVNQLQYLLLTGYEIIEQGENYSILCDKQNQEPYYWIFAHGKDIESIDNVCLINSGSIDKIAKPKKINDDAIEFIEYSTNYAGNQTRHWYFRISDCQLSYWYWNVREIKDNLIVYASSYMEGGKSRIIIHDMFDKSADYKEITGDFPDPRNDDFLISAEFTTNGELNVEYIGKDGKKHKDVFSLD